MKTKYLITIGILLVFLISACSNKESDKIKIGVSLPQTGFANNLGIYVKNGIDIAVERIGEENAKNIELIYEDDKCTATGALNVANKLINSDNVHFIIGPFCSAAINPTIQQYDEAKILRMITGLGADSYVNQGEYKFIFMGQIKDLMKSLAEYSYKKGLRKIAILYQNEDYGAENAIYFEKYFTELGGKVVGKEGFDRNERDFKTPLIKLKETNSEAIFIAATGNNMVNALREMEELNINVVKLGIRNTQDPEIVKSAGELVEGVIYPYFEPEPKTDLTEWYSNKYYEKYGSKPELVSAAAFDSFNLLIEAIDSCKKNDVECVYKEIEDVKSYNGASGYFLVNENGVAVRDAVIKTIKDGKFELIY